VQHLSLLVIVHDESGFMMGGREGHVWQFPRQSHAKDTPTGRRAFRGGTSKPGDVIKVVRVSC